MDIEPQEILTEVEIKAAEEIGLNPNGKLLDPKVDIIFKAIFTSNRRESHEALRNLLSSIIGREVKDVRIKNNEIASTGIRQKQSTFDVYATFNDGEDADIEMQVLLADNIPSRAEYNTAKMYCSQEIKGLMYQDLKEVYTIIIMASTLYHDNNRFFNEFVYRNQYGDQLPGHTHIVFIELSKLDDISDKPVVELTDTEMWALFLQYANDENKQQLIQEILKRQEGIKMGSEVLNDISTDHDQWIQYFLRMKAEIDEKSRIRYAETIGHAKGHAEGLAEGHAEGNRERAIKDAITVIKQFHSSLSDAIEALGIAAEDRDEIVRQLKDTNTPYTE
jgi:predicted transposase/invertase (TIGR01784 family)